MTSPVINEQFYSGAFIVSEARGFRSRMNAYLDNPGTADVLFQGGLVVSQNTTGAVAAAHPANVGNGTISTPSLLAGNLFGTYTIVFTSPTAFNVVAPSGDVIGTGTTGTAFATQVGFTITAGGTAFAAGDTFTLTVTVQAGSYQSWTGGAFTQLALLFNRLWVSAGTSRKCTVIVRDCEVNAAELQWDPAVLAAANAGTLQNNALAALAAPGVNIIPR